MSFPPESQRVIYGNNPLERVICQVRFPPILKIDATLPDDFQESIRFTFPKYEEKMSGPDLPDNLVSQLPDEVARVLPIGSRKTYEFSSSDGEWTVALTRDFVALSTSAYTRWEEFRERFLVAFQALKEVYRPTDYTRVGLRYQDVIHRNRLGLQGTPWAELLNPRIAGLLMVEGINEKKVNTFTESVEMQLDECGSTVKLRHGFAMRPGSAEVYYLIDSDYYAVDLEEEGANVIDRLSCFNRLAGRLFRWCITEPLHNAMEPRDIK